MVSKNMTALIAQLRKFKERIRGMSVDDFRAGMDYMASLSQVPADVVVEVVDAGGVPALWVSTPAATPNQVIFQIHGGAFIAGSAWNDRDFAGRLSRGAGARVLSVDYRLAPEHPYPAAWDDCIAAYRWLLETGVDPSQVVFCGASAGGNLALATLVRLRDEGDLLPEAAVLLSPGADLSASGTTLITNAETEAWLPAELTSPCYPLALGDADPLHPYASPVFANLAGLPPILIQVGSTEMLLNDAVRIAENAKAAGVAMQLAIWDDVPHVFTYFSPSIPEVQQGMTQIVDFIQKYLPPSEANSPQNL